MPVITIGKTIADTNTLVDSPQNTRSYVGIQNLDAANNIYVSFGGTPATTTTGIRIGPGEFLDMNAPFNGSAINAISVGGPSDIVFMFGS
jgi:hypothetical protein